MYIYILATLEEGVGYLPELFFHSFQEALHNKTSRLYILRMQLGVSGFWVHHSNTWIDYTNEEQS